MNQLLDPTFFQVSAPRNDKYLRRYWVQPSVFSALLNPESCLLAAPGGYGKSTLALVAQQQMQNAWLNITLEQLENSTDDFITALLRQITHKMWQHIEDNPSVLANLQTRAVAVHYFLTLFSEIDLGYLLARLAEDFPEHEALIQTFQGIQPRELFGANASPAQRLSVLCDCAQKLGVQGIVVWVDLTGELKQLPLPLKVLLEDFFSSLYLMRRKILHIKCLALPSVCQHLRGLRGVETLSAAVLELTWRPEELQALVARRLQLASAQRVQALAQLVDEAKFLALLQNSANAGSPVEWLALTHMIVAVVNEEGRLPLSEQAWLRIQRTYYAERVKLYMDEQGSFWRGNRLLADLTPKKRAIYPLIRYLYENPGTHRTYQLLKVLNIDEQNLSTIVSRARKEHIEPLAGDAEEAWIYLVTDFRGGGYALRHTDRSP